MICTHCFKERKEAEGWDSCNEAQDAHTRLDIRIDAMKRQAERGAPEPKTAPITDSDIGHTIKTMKTWEQDERK